MNAVGVWFPTDRKAPHMRPRIASHRSTRRLRVWMAAGSAGLAAVLGLTLIPGRDPAGQPYRMSFFDAFYVMSYTASTIDFGEIPYAFTSS